MASRTVAAAEAAVKLAMDAFLLLSPMTGIGRYIRHLVQGLAQRPGLEVELFYGLRWSRELREAPVPGIGRAKALVKRFVPAPYALLRMTRQLAFTAGASRRGIDVYHAPAFLPLRFHGPTVITVHDLAFVRFPQMHSAAMVRAVNDRLPRAIEQSAFVLVDSDFVRDEVLAVYRPPPEKVITTHLGVAEAFRPLSAEEARPVLARHGLQYGQYILTVGTLEPRKNLKGALRAYGMLPAALRGRYPLVLAGMPGWQLDGLAEELEAGARNGAVKPLGYVADADLPGLYAGARVFLYPSLYEGFGLPVLEAFACGAPVVTSNGSSLKELAAGYAATVDPADPVAIRAALVEALEGGEDRGEQERRIAWARTFTWARCAARTAQIYQRALAAA